MRATQHCARPVMYEQVRWQRKKSTETRAAEMGCIEGKRLERGRENIIGKKILSLLLNTETFRVVNSLLNYL